MAINYCNQDIKGTLTTTGNITSGGSITMPDYIYHTGDTNTYFGFYGGDGFKIVVGGENKIAADDLAAYLYYNGNVKLSTTNTGVQVTGVVGGSGANLSGNIVLDDNSGASPNIQFINEDGDSWYIYNDSNGKFQVQQN